jgi:hypothetical protein
MHAAFIVQRTTDNVRHSKCRAACSRLRFAMGRGGLHDALCGMPRCGMLRACVRALAVIAIFSAIAFEYFRCTHRHP